MNALFKKILVVVAIIVFVFNAKGQDKDNPWAISFGVNAVDFYPVNISGMKSEAGIGTQWYDQFFNLNDHYNYISAPTKLSLGRYLNKNFNVEVAGSINKITKLGSVKLEESLSYVALDINLNYDLNNIIGETSWFDPYAIAGIGGKLQKKIFDSTPTLNSGLGTKIWLYKNVGFKIQTIYKHTLRKKFDSHFQHSASIIYKFGGYDDDNDGVYDKDDKCPEVFGLKEFNGCPDTDEDGISDAEDECPDIFGVAGLNGCPDTDGDGVADKNDNCPYIRGVIELNGCPDTDGDGTIDQRDRCPRDAGPKDNQGCPEEDSDGDGIIDKIDKCKYEVGVAENNGCPKVVDNTLELEAKLMQLANSVLFISGSDMYYTKYEEKLDEIASLMKSHNNLKFQIRGHTDNVGPEEGNLKLSLARVNKILNYLVSKGINQFNLNVEGLGESEPLESNNTAEGRAKNRRVEIKILRE